MTRYTKYKKSYNTRTIAQEPHPRNTDSLSETSLSREERRQIKLDKQQSVEVLRVSKNLRSKPVCLKCRKRGHSVKFCPQGRESICYNCGSHEHTLRECHRPREGSGFAFASCFICQQQGHLASDCSKNERGIYPRGGGCRFCGSKLHLARDCRPTKEAETGAFVAASVDPRQENPDDDLVHSALKGIQDERTQRKQRRKGLDGSGEGSKRKPKVVNF